jgi:aminoglycoside phosphotransferase
MNMQPSFSADPSFPALEAALDPQRLAQSFARALAAASFPSSDLSCEIERVRHKRGRKLLIGCRLHGRDAIKRPFDQRVMISLYPAGDPVSLPDIARDNALATPGFGPPQLTLEEIGGQAWFFPNDRKLHHIADLLDNPYGAAEVIHYVPEQGCTVRIARPDQPAVFGKCRADGRGSVAAAVQASAGPHARAVRLAPILGHDDAHGLLWQQEVAGLAVDPADIVIRPHHWTARIATALLDFHALPAPSGLKQLTVESVAATLAGRVQRTAAAMPQMAPQIIACHAALNACQPAAQTLVLSHCDLHPGNLLWDGERFALIDLDTAALAPAALDYGTLAAALIHKAIEANARDVAIRNLIAAMRSAAQREIGDGRLFDWFAAASLIGERLYRCTTRMKSPRFCVRDRLLATAVALVVDHG